MVVFNYYLGIMSDPLVLTENELKKETPTPPPHRRPAKSFSVSSSSQKGEGMRLQILTVIKYLSLSNV